MNFDLADIPAAWIEFTNRTNPKGGDINHYQYSALKGEEDWAVMALYELLLNKPYEAFEVIYRIADISNDDWIFENLGSGPLESALYNNLDDLKIYVAAHGLSEGVLKALSYSWIQGLSREAQDFVKSLSSGINKTIGPI